MTKGQRDVLRELVDQCVDGSELVVHNIPVEQIEWLLDAADERDRLVKMAAALMKKRTRKAQVSL